MKKLTQLHLQNFKAFRDEKLLLNENHALIFGTNGSGKSSVFWSLYTLLQSSGKSMAEVDKYFEPYHPHIGTTYESLRNVYAPDTEDSTIGLAWIDAATGQETWRHIGLSRHETLPRPAGADDTVYRALRNSDFLHYRSLQWFFNQPHSEGANLWPVFAHEILPFAPPFATTLPKSRTLGSYWEEIQKGPPRGSIRPKTTKKGEEARAKYEQLLTDFNEELKALLLRLNTATNTLLQDVFFGGEGKVKVEMKLMREMDFNVARRADWWLDIQLVVSVPPVNGTRPLPIVRPQTFLNEAQLMRVAFGIRVAALKDRHRRAGTPPDELAILCLDDVLISLDMSNRRHLLDWLFDPAQKIGDDYQILFLTHDRELFKMVREYIRREDAADEWQVFELSLDDEVAPAERKPSVLTDSTDYLQQAQKHFDNHDLATCANYLRKEAEARLKNFLPPALYWTEPDKEGEERSPMLGVLIGLLTKLLQDHQQFKAPLNELAWAKNSALNPLSHDHYGTTTYRDEIRHLLKVVFPKLRDLKRDRTPFIALPANGGRCRVTLTDTDAAGVACQFIAEIHDPIWRFTFPDNTTDLSYARCRLEKVRVADSNGAWTDQKPKGSDLDCRTLHCLHKRMHETFKHEGQGVAVRPSLEFVVRKL